MKRIWMMIGASDEGKLKDPRALYLKISWQQNGEGMGPENKSSSIMLEVKT